MDIKEFINKEFFGLPAWMWATAIVGGGILGFFILKQTSGSPQSAVSNDLSNQVNDISQQLQNIENQVNNQSTNNPPANTTTTNPTNTDTNNPTPTPAPVQRTYTVQSGNTLSGIGAMLGIPWQTIFQNNLNIIEQTARNHGFASSQNGRWIFPGEVLNV